MREARRPGGWTVAGMLLAACAASEPGRSETRLKAFVTQPEFVDWVLQTLRHESRIRQLETRQRNVFAPEGVDR